MMNDDMELVREYAARQSEPAFAALVERHINLVYSAALRQGGDAPLAEEITQAVFILLARKAETLRLDTRLSGWLYRTARYVAADALKSRRRRQHYEKEAFMESTLDNARTEEVWQELAPLLDEAMAGLGQTDRDALMLRYFENKSLREVGSALGTSEEAAKKRVARGLEKLRAFFARRGMAHSSAVIAGAVSANSIQAAPIALAKSVTAVAVVKGAAASASTLTLIKGALKIMAWTKAKTVVVGIGIFLVAGTGTVIMKNGLSKSEPSYQGRRLSEWLVDIEYGQPPEKRQQAGEAIRHMGAKSLPFLLATLADKDAGNHRYNQASWAFDALGPIAKPAIPKLTQLLEQCSGYVPSALAGIGPDAMPELLNALTNGSFFVRDNTAAALANALYSRKISSSQASAAFPIALKNLTYANADSLFQENTRWRAAGLLGALKLEPDASIPALMRGLEETNLSIAAECANALSAFRQQAKPAIPLLIKAANSTNVMLNTAAKMALNQIEEPAGRVIIRQ
jgi:RNA polymerase sigma factor (sigma-70 family)